MLDNIFSECRGFLTFLCICLLYTAGVESVLLQELEGNNVTIHIGLNGIQNDAQILLFYGPRNADRKIVNSLFINGKTVTEIADDRFKDRTQLDRTSGSLTIRNISRDDSGIYKLQVITKSLSDYSFSIVVYAAVSKPVIKNRPEERARTQSKTCSPVCSVENGNNVSLSWYKGKERISTMSNIFNLSATLDLKLQHSDKSIYTCEAANPVDKQKTQLNLEEVCGIKSDCSTCRNLNQTLAAVLTPTGLVIVLLIGLACYLTKKKKAQVTDSVEEAYYADVKSIQQGAHEGEIATVSDVQNSQVVYSVVNTYK